LSLNGAGLDETVKTPNALLGQSIVCAIKRDSVPFNDARLNETIHLPLNGAGLDETFHMSFDLPI
jgi:hypothetical protein